MSTQNSSSSWRKTLLVSLAVSFCVLIIVFIGTLLVEVVSYLRPTSEVTVSGIAKKEIQYDKVVARMYIFETGLDVQKLNKSVDEKTQKVLTYLKSLGLQDKDIQTNKTSYQDYSQPIILTEETTSTRAGAATSSTSSLPDRDTSRIRVESSIQITFNDVEAVTKNLNTYLQKVTELGVNRFDPLQYSIKDEDKVCEELKTLAIEDAREKGIDRISALGGRRVVRTKLVNDITGCGNDFVYPAIGASRAPDEKMDDSSLPEVLTGQKELSVSVSVTFEYR